MICTQVKELKPSLAGDSLESYIGNTPLIRLRNVARNLPSGVEVLVKAEHLNPGGSVKDRAALAMILAGEKSGRLRPGQTILDATSGNTGIAYGMIGAARGYPVTICLPKNASAQRKQILRSYGVELIETDPLQATDGAQLVAREGAYATLRLRSGEMRRVLIECRATLGEVGNSEHSLRSYGKAGARRWRGIRPTVRGVAMNPVDHPHGGGEGKTSGGRNPVTPWGQSTRGYKTRHNKRTKKMIVRDRRVK